MQRDENREFLEAEKHEIEKHKWIEGEKLGRDPGNDAIIDWIRKYAKRFREEWDELHKKF